MSLKQVDFLLNGLVDTNGNPLSGGKVYAYIAGTTTPVQTFTDRDGTILSTNPIILDSYGKAQIYGDGIYKFIVKTASEVTLYTHDNIYVGYPDSIQKVAEHVYNTTVPLKITNDFPSLAYNIGDEYSFQYTGVTPGAITTIKVDDLPSKSLVRFDGTTMEAGDIVPGGLYTVVYNGTLFVLQNLEVAFKKAIQKGTYIWGGTSTGSANAQVVSLNPVLSAEIIGMAIYFKAGFTNTGACTLKVYSTATPIEIRKISAGAPVALASGDIQVGRILVAVYDGTYFQLV